MINDSCKILSFHLFSSTFSYLFPFLSSYLPPFSFLSLFHPFSSLAFYHSPFLYSIFIIFRSSHHLYHPTFSLPLYLLFASHSFPLLSLFLPSSSSLKARVEQSKRRSYSFSSSSSSSSYFFARIFRSSSNDNSKTDLYISDFNSIPRFTTRVIILLL